MATQDFWGKFRGWRRSRPFWGSLFLLLSGFWFFFSANMSLGNLHVHIGPTGFLSYVIPLVMVVCGALCMFTPAQRMFYGIVSLLTALYSFIGLNLGGLFLGMLIGILGGALVIAWGPPRIRPAAAREQPEDTEPTPGEYADADIEHDDQEPTTAPAGADVTQRIDVAGHDDRPSKEHDVAGVVPGFDEEVPQPRGGGIARLGRNPKAMVIAIVPLALTAGILVAGGRIPASADTCPKGIVTAAAPTTKAPATRKATTAKPKQRATTKAAPRTTAPKGTKAPATGKAATTAAPPASDSEDASAHPVANALKNLAGGLGNLLGVGDDSSAAPSTSPSPSPSATTPAATTPAAGPATTAPAGEPAKTEPAKTTTTAPAPARTTKTTTAPKPAATGDIVPCLGARAYGLKADPEAVPLVGDEPGVMTAGTLTMDEFQYEGTTTLTTGSGTKVEVMKIDMSRAVNTPFTLTVPEKTGHTVIKSNKLTVSGNVRFYSTKFEGKLLGIPITFTPDSPPPSLPIPSPIPLIFTEVTLTLDFVRCDTLTGLPLDLRPQN